MAEGSSRWTKIAAVLTILFVIGGAAGWYAGTYLGTDLGQDKLADAQSSAERFDLGRDSYTFQSRSTTPVREAAPAAQNTTLGEMRNGARLLVPNEPARKKQRSKLEADTATQENWRDENFPAIEEEDFRLADQLERGNSNDASAARRAREQEKTINRALGRSASANGAATIEVAPGQDVPNRSGD